MQRLAMPTKPKQQRAYHQAHLRDAVVKAFQEWCVLYKKTPNESAAREFTSDMGGVFEGTSSVELMAFIRSDHNFQL